MKEGRRHSKCQVSAQGLPQKDKRMKGYQDLVNKANSSTPGVSQRLKYRLAFTYMGERIRIVQLEKNSEIGQANLGLSMWEQKWKN